MATIDEYTQNKKSTTESEDFSKIKLSNRWLYLTTKRTESEGIKKASLTNFTGIGDAFSGPRLWTFVQEHNLCAVDNVSLHWTDVQVFLNLGHSDHIVIRWPSNLEKKKSQLESIKITSNDLWVILKFLEMVKTMMIKVRIGVNPEGKLQEWLALNDPHD